jgi:hypothetical protein
MTDQITENNNTPERPLVGKLIDFVNDVDENNHLEIEVAIKEDGKVVVFHNRTFKKEIAWFEFDLETNKLDFVLDDGDIRDVGVSLHDAVAKHMQNSHQILTVFLDNDSGDAVEGNYIPLIIHRS